MSVEYLVRMNELGSCNEWQGARFKKGYGARRYKGRIWRAHRAAWDEQVGPIPDAMRVLHRCDNPACCEIAHLFLGTNADNSADMVAKGRQARKLGDYEISEICDRYSGGGITQSALAHEFGVSQAAICRVVHLRATRQS